MRTVREIGPLGVGVALVSALAWYLIDRGEAIGAWLLAGLLLAHGWVHLMFVFPKPVAATAGGPTWPFDFERSWLIRAAGLDGGTVRALGSGAMAVTCATSLLAALATVGLLVPTDWWATLVVVAAGSSLLLLGLCYSPTLILGLAIDIALMWLVFGSGWRP
jgi:hypothetical protein